MAEKVVVSDHPGNIQRWFLIRFPGELEMCAAI
jgi:hypothetical protein